MRVQQRTQNRELAARAAACLTAPLRANLRIQVIALVLAVLCNNAAGQSQSKVIFRMIDDLDGTPNSGVMVISDGEGEIISIVTDFNDLHHFVLPFDEVTTIDSEGAGAIDALNIIWLGETPRADRLPTTTYTLPQSAEPLRMRAWLNQTVVRESPTTTSCDGPPHDLAPLSELFALDDDAIADRIGLSYGLGAIDIGRDFEAIATGGYVGRNAWKTGVDNQILGPKAGIIWQQRRGAISVDVQGFAMLGVNTVQVAQSTTLSAPIIPGALNRPLYARSIYTSSNDWRAEIASAAEFRAQLSNHLSERLSIHCRWSSLAIQNIVDPAPFSMGPTVYDYVGVSKSGLILHEFYCGIAYAR